MDNRPIAFFDSGIGGATILKEVMKHLPNENYIYYPDSSNNPYGNKSKEELFYVVDNVVQKLLIYNPKMIVCACNTATAIVLNDIRKKYQNMIFIGTEPSVKVVFDQYQDLNCLILTTKGTGESEKFQELFYKYKTPNSILVEAPLLAELIEKEEDTYPYLKQLLNNFSDIDLVVLGCTHFPLAKENIQRVLGDVQFIDGRVGIANRIHHILTENNMVNDEKFSTINILCSDKKIKKRILDILENSL